MPRARKSVAQARAEAETEAQKEAREAEELAIRNARLAEIHKRHLQLQEQNEAIVEEDNELKKEAAELVGKVLGTHVHDGGEIQLQPNRRFHQATAEEVIKAISEDLLKSLMVEVIDSKKAKDVLPPATYRKCMKESDDPKVVFK